MSTGVNEKEVRLAELVATLSYAADLGLGQPFAHCIRKTVIEGSGLERVKRVAALPTMRKRVSEFLTTHATLASQFATQIGLDSTVATAIRHFYEQWDGKACRSISAVTRSAFRRG